MTLTTRGKAPVASGPGLTTPAAATRPPDPIRALAERHRLRCYRDPCGDHNIPGRRGELFWYGSGLLGLQVSGPRANGAPTAPTAAGANRVIACLRREGRWEVSQAGDGEAVFLVPVSDIRLAARAIKAYRKRRPPSREVMDKGADTLRAWREHKAQQALKALGTDRNARGYSG